MLQGALEGLPHLRRGVGRRVVGQALVLAADRGELRLQEKVLAPDPLLPQRQQRLAHPRLVVVLELVGRVDRRKPASTARSTRPVVASFFHAVP
jgi:hypothetical protein